MPQPPMAEPSEVATSIPTPITSFIGRDLELAECADLLRQPSIRLLTLVGPGGVGKTRLAMKLGIDLETSFKIVVFVSLANLRDAALVPDTVAAGLGIPNVGDGPVTDLARDHLVGTETLLVLDSVEGVAAAAPWIASLLIMCPTLQILATSRERLAVYGEQVYSVPPLTVAGPANGTSPTPPSESDAVCLFVQRARAVLPDFSITDTTQSVVREICARLDGLPLAIELAAARSHILSPPALLARLEARLPLLVGGPSDMPIRHRTLRDAIDWSYSLLTAAEQLVFRRLSVFTGTFSLDAAEAVCRQAPGSKASGHSDAATTPDPVLDTIAALVDKSLLQPASTASSEPRFAMLDTIREFGFEQLTEAGEAAAVQRAHASHFLDLAEHAEGALTGTDPAPWISRLKEERNNLRTTLAWSLESGETELGLRLGAALWRFWVSEGNLREGSDWLKRALVVGGDAPPAARAKALHYLGNLAVDLGDYPQARASFEAGLALRRELGDKRGIATSLTGLGLVAATEGAYDTARELHQESLRIKHALGDRHGEARSLYNMGQAATAAGDLSAAHTFYEAAVTIQRHLGDPTGEAYSTWGLGEAHRRQGNPEEAIVLLNQALDHFRQVDDRHGVAFSLHGLACISADSGKPQRAAELYREALDLRVQLGDRVGVIECIEGLAALLAKQGEIERATRWWSTAAAERVARHVPVPVVDQAAHSQAVDRARTALGGAAFSAAWAAGSYTTLDATIDAALAVPIAPANLPEQNHGLTAREMEVLRHIAAGETDREIAAALYISHRTASTHVVHVYSKLNVTSRAAAAAWAVRNGIA